MQLIILTLTVLGTVLAHEPLSQELVDYVNNVQDQWTAGENGRFNDMPLEVIKSTMGVIDAPFDIGLDEIKLNLPREIPDNFDSRDQWPDCPTIKEVRDQAACGSCWAFGAVEAISDRICIHSKGQQKPHISAEDLLSCCWLCGQGCNGGFPQMAWHYYAWSGLVTGSNYTQKSGCQPYTIAPCEHHTTGRFKPCGASQRTPSCSKQCIAGYGKSYKEDKFYASRAYTVSSNVESIQREIMTNGPVEATYTVYSDFLNYKSGVYRHTTGGPLGGHAVKMIGWGVENNVPYWIIANSWNSDWGDKGFFKIQRGNNECGIEQGIVAGTPK